MSSTDNVVIISTGIGGCGNCHACLKSGMRHIYQTLSVITISYEHLFSADSNLSDTNMNDRVMLISCT